MSCNVYVQRIFVPSMFVYTQEENFTVIKISTLINTKFSVNLKNLWTEFEVIYILT